MPYIIGVVGALLVAVFARVVGLDRDRAFYPTVMIVIALIYVLFAVMGGSMQALAIDGLIMIAFVVMAVMGFKRSLGLVALALVAHGVMDLFHAGLVNNPGVPAFWPAFCMAYDVTAGGYLAWVVWRSSPKARLTSARA
jgi:hypothetical protein